MTVKWSHNIFLGIEFVNLSYRELCTQYRDSTFTDFNGKSWDRTTQHFSHHKTSQTQAIKVQIRSNSCKLIWTMKGWSCTGLIDFLLFLKIYHQFCSSFFSTLWQSHWIYFAVILLKAADFGNGNSLKFNIKRFIKQFIKLWPKILAAVTQGRGKKIYRSWDIGFWLKIILDSIDFFSERFFAFFVKMWLAGRLLGAGWYLKYFDREMINKTTSHTICRPSVKVTRYQIQTSWD